IKQMLEGPPVSRHPRLHLDRCLTCRACETTCPSGVEYARLLDIGRAEAERRIPRPWRQRALRWLLRAVLPEPTRFARWLKLGQTVRPLLPASLRSRVPAPVSAPPWPTSQHARQVILPGGCVQPALAPDIDAVTARVLDRLGIAAIRAGGCCGAVDHHLSATDAARQRARANIDAWWPHIEAGAEAIVSTASGCGVMIKEYDHLLRQDPAYADKARRVAELTQDLVEILDDHATGLAETKRPVKKISVHEPCTLQHGQRLGGRLESLLRRAGYTLLPVADAHLCCGSAGTYALTQPALSRQLRENKLAALNRHAPELIVTANIGCLTHLAGNSPVPVRHWVTLFDPAE
ncbi:MAG TPA: glycolate oxidase subunit GlcF, partial [Chromatiales bacterium]|nr:glycolate oxidase subunit GlcF [Chromatiales bacterium]